MTPLHIPATEYTPHVHFDAETNTLSLTGEVYPENASAYFAPISEWIEEAIGEEVPLKLSFSIDYLNTSSTKAILDLIQLLEDYHLDGGSTGVTWTYQSSLEVMKESGEELLEDFSLPCLLKPLD